MAKLHYNFLEKISGLAIFSFLLGIFPWLLLFVDEYLFPNTEISFPRGHNLAQLSSWFAMISGVIAFFYIRKAVLKGKWLAVVATILGIVGCFLFVSF